MKNYHKTSSPPKLAALLASAALLLGMVSQSALAAGTASSTSITNLATIQYAVGASTLTICSSDVGNATLDDDGTCVAGAFGAVNTSFAVDNKVDVLVAEVSTTFTTSVAGTTGQLTSFTVTNQGNTTQDFALSLSQPVGGTLFAETDNFDATACTVSNIVVVGAGSMGTYTALDQHINALAADSAATVTVSCSIPALQADGDFAIVALTATARADNALDTLGGAIAETANTVAGVEIVFGDAAGSDDALGDGAHSARDGYLVAAPSLTIQKTVATLCDPVDGATTPHNIPGAVVRWTITIANTGTGSANLTSIADAIPTNTTFDPDLITGAGVGTACEFAAAGLGTPENANGNGVRIQNTNARAMAGTAAGASTSSYFTGAADADGVTVGASVAVDFTVALPAGGAYTAGELKPAETITVYYNVGVN